MEMVTILPSQMPPEIQYTTENNNLRQWPQRIRAAHRFATESTLTRKAPSLSERPLNKMASSVQKQCTWLLLTTQGTLIVWPRTSDFHFALENTKYGETLCLFL